MNIRNPKELEDAIIDYKGDSDTLLAIVKYKWYNYYQNLHIKRGSKEDLENDKIFEQIKVVLPGLHKLIEKGIDWEIEKLDQ